MVNFLKRRNRDDALKPALSRVEGALSHAPAQTPSSWPQVPGSEIVLSHHPLSVVSEAYRALRTAILLSRAGEPPKTVLFTSGVGGEGKTTTMINTAITLTQMGVKVLVIDADLRRPRCHELLRMENRGVGLTELLTGQRELQEVIKSTAVDNLFLLSSGSIPPNPTELVGSREMRETLDTLVFLQDYYSYIFIDSPPVMPVSDAMLLSTLVDGVVLVVDRQKTPRKVVKEACLRLRRVRAKILGVVLNRVDTQSGGYAYHYRHYYSYIGTGEAE